MANEVTPTEAYSAMSDEHKALIDTWIKKNIRAAKNIYPHSSYWFKHVVEREIGQYTSSPQFTGAMIKAGYIPIDGYSHPWKFRVKYIGSATAQPGMFPAYLFENE